MSALGQPKKQLPCGCYVEYRQVNKQGSWAKGSWAISAEAFLCDKGHKQGDVTERMSEPGSPSKAEEQPHASEVFEGSETGPGSLTLLRAKAERHVVYPLNRDECLALVAVAEAAELVAAYQQAGGNEWWWDAHDKLYDALSALPGDVGEQA